METCRKIVFFGVAVWLVLHSSQAAACEAGDKKCGPDGRVMECQVNKNRLRRATSKWLSTSVACVPPSTSTATQESQDGQPPGCVDGDKKCGPDGRIMECKVTNDGVNPPSSKWLSTSVACVPPPATTQTQ